MKRGYEWHYRLVPVKNKGFVSPLGWFLKGLGRFVSLTWLCLQIRIGVFSRLSPIKKGGLVSRVG